MMILDITICEYIDEYFITLRQYSAIVLIINAINYALKDYRCIQAIFAVANSIDKNKTKVIALHTHILFICQLK